ncbi:MAG: hypothetical protein RIS64_3923 [Bacteroidota bacterium]|jgi:hypothetical protein
MRKRRTRQHLIEDLGFNHVERQILYANYTVQRYERNDYGYDGIIHTFNDQGEIESFMIHFQLKSTDHLQWTEDKKNVKFDLSKQDLELWLLSSLVMLLVLYDAVEEKAYFLDLQAYFASKRIALTSVKKWIRIQIPIENLFSSPNIQSFYHSKK